MACLDLVLGSVFLSKVCQWLGAALPGERVYLPGEVEQSSGALQGHEVVSEVEMGEVLAVEEVGRQLLQTAAGQVHRVDPLGHHLIHRGRGEKGETWCQT